MTITRQAIIDGIKSKIPNIEEKYTMEYASYIIRAKDEKKKVENKQTKVVTYEIVNKILNQLSLDAIVDKYVEWYGKGEHIDGIHIVFIERFGKLLVNFDYVAYKNKMLRVYPETTVDIGLIYEGDEYNFENDSGKYTYSHKMNNIFNRTDDKCIGGFILIKNRRGEFLTTLNKSDIEQRKEMAPGDFIWTKWFKEMVLKSLWRSGTKTHFDDIYQELNSEDNEQYDLSKLENQDENKEKKQKEKIIEKFKNL